MRILNRARAKEKTVARKAYIYEMNRTLVRIGRLGRSGFVWQLLVMDERQLVSAIGFNPGSDGRSQRAQGELGGGIEMAQVEQRCSVKQRKQKP